MSELVKTIEEKCRLDKHPLTCKIIETAIGILLGNAIVYFYIFNKVLA